MYYMMPYQTLTFYFVLLLLCLSHVYCTQDEFSEFDDEFHPDEINQAGISEASEAIPGGKTDAPDTFSSERSINVSPLKAALDKEESPASKDANPQPHLKLVQAALNKSYRLESYFVEGAFILACALYALNFFIGCSKNQNFAMLWYEQVKDVFKQQFTLVGGAPYIETDGKREVEESLAAFKKQKGLIKSSESTFYVWNSGRVGVDGLLVELCLLKRQDLFNMALNLLKVDKDTVYFRCLLSNDGYENFVFCLATKTLAPKLAHDLVDINSFCSKKKPLSQYGIDIPRLVVMSELNDVATFLLDQKTGSFINKYWKSINYIHITDQFSMIRDEVPTAQKLAVTKRMATFCFDIPQSEADRVEFILFSLNLLDRIRKFKLARDSKQKSEKNRQRITDILQKTAFSQRQEAAQAKKEELRRLEKERIYNEDDPEKQKKWEKKEAKRELKKNKMRVRQLKVKAM